MAKGNGTRKRGPARRVSRELRLARREAPRWPAGWPRGDGWPHSRQAQDDRIAHMLSVTERQAGAAQGDGLEGSPR